MVYNNVLEALGHTPVIRLNHMTDEDSAQIFVKYEGLNVGGSIKTRTAYNMFMDAKNRGIIKEVYTPFSIADNYKLVGANEKVKKKYFRLLKTV